MVPVIRLAVPTAILALATFAPIASGGSIQGFHLDKTCSEAASYWLGN